MDQQQLKIWFAGFYEGEGCVTNDKSNNNRLRISISQNDITPLNKAVELWGGNIYKRERKSPASDKICIGYEWRICHETSKQFIKDIENFMIIPYKINQIKDALKLSEKGNAETYKCNFCENVYASPAGRRRHEKKEHIDKGTLYVCSICQSEYKSIDSLKRHIKLKHSNINSNASVSEN